MNEILRLLRLSLLLRIAAGVLGAVGLASFVTAMKIPLLGQLSLVSIASNVLTLGLLGISFAAPHRGWVTPRFTRGLLAATIVVFAIEHVVPFIALNLFLPGDSLQAYIASSGNPNPPSVEQIDAMRVSQQASSIMLPLSLGLIPAVLGAWLSGRKGALRWSVFTIVVGALAAVVTLATVPVRLDQRMFPINPGVLTTLGVVTVVVCFFVGSLADRQRAEHAQLEEANQQLLRQAYVREQLAGSRERVRLARDLHDTLAHTLAALSIQINAVGAVLDGEQLKARRELANASQLVKEGLANTRNSIGELRANLIGELGLAGALRRQTETVSQRSGIAIEFELVGEEPQLRDASADALFRIAQEALNNIERHSRATHATIRLSHAADERLVVLGVKDDGVGFNAQALDRVSFGIRGMRERAELIGAHVRVDSVLGSGTVVEVRLRLASEVDQAQLSSKK